MSVGTGLLPASVLLVPSTQLPGVLRMLCSPLALCPTGRPHRCTGSTAACPADAKKPSTTVCRAAKDL